MSTNKNIPFIATAFFVGIVLGAGLWAIVGGGDYSARNDTKGVSAEHEALKQAVRQQYPEYFDDSMGIFNSGVVEDVKGNSIVFKRYVPETLLLASDIQETVEIVIDENTKIIKNTEKDEAVFAVELAAYEVAFAEYQNQVAVAGGDILAPEFNFVEPAYPSFMLEEEILLSDVGVGNLISVSRQQDILIDPTDDSLAPELAPTMTTITIQESLDVDMGEEI